VKRQFIWTSIHSYETVATSTTRNFITVKYLTQITGNSFPQNTRLHGMQLSMAYLNVKGIPDNEEVKYTRHK
jgi:hypothetical protein